MITHSLRISVIVNNQFPEVNHLIAHLHPSSIPIFLSIWMVIMKMCLFTEKEVCDTNETLKIQPTKIKKQKQKENKPSTKHININDLAKRTQ